MSLCCWIVLAPSTLSFVPWLPLPFPLCLPIKTVGKLATTTTTTTTPEMAFLLSERMNSVGYCNHRRWSPIPLSLEKNANMNITIRHKKIDHKEKAFCQLFWLYLFSSIRCNILVVFVSFFALTPSPPLSPLSPTEIIQIIRKLVLFMEWIYTIISLLLGNFQNL